MHKDARNWEIRGLSISGSSECKESDEEKKS